MRIHADLQLKDIPGQLVKALIPISEYGGNIVGIMHAHDKVINGRIAVRLIFDVENEKLLNSIVKEVEERDVFIAKMGEIYEKIERQSLLIGKDVGVHIKEIIDKMSTIEGVNLSNFKFSISQLENESAALLMIEANNKEQLKQAQDVLESLSYEKTLLLVKGVE